MTIHSLINGRNIRIAILLIIFISCAVLYKETVFLKLSSLVNLRAKEVYIREPDQKDMEVIEKKDLVENDDGIITLMFVGDIMLSRAIGSIMLKNNDWNYPFLKMRDHLQKPDITFANLEGPISNSGIKVGSIFSFRADPRSVGGLLYSGIDIVSIANNHMWDYGRLAFNDNSAILTKNNISYTGGGDNYALAHSPTVKTVKGTKVAFLAYTNLLPASIGRQGAEPSVAFPDEQQLVLDIQAAKKLADIIVVSFHWGEEYMTVHNSYQENLGHMAVDAGANLVIGHHPHVVQDVEEYKGATIVYSLGNFVFDQNFSEDTRSGMIFTATFKDKKFVSGKQEKVKFTPTYQPYLDTQ